jgi:hypothetical protein
LSTGSTNTLGKYEIIREIGRSNDIVYEANDPTINRRVALKELSVPPAVQGAQRRERIERFWREGKAAGKLAHPNIVTVYEVGQDGDRYFIAMEFLEGQTLRDVIQSGGPLSLKDAISYALQLCSALEYAHEHGVIHRDVKPENVQILPGGFAKLTDFGIARLMGESPITQDGQVFGTPSYMSPEQVAGKSLDARSDIFSLGVMLYEMVAGSKPFSGDSIVTVTYNIMNMQPSPPPGASQWLVGVIQKAMSKDPNARYDSADAMAEDLREEKCAGMGFGIPPQQNGYGAYPSPFGGASQGPYSPPGAYPPPQAPPGPLTPYGTPMPSQGGGGLPVAAPDPFAQRVPQAPMPPSGPPAPIMSSETRNFLGVFLLVIGFAGMLVFAIWAVNLAFNSYQGSVTGEHARRYLDQGSKLYGQGNVDGAIEQWRNAMRVSPDSKEAKSAEDNVFKALVNRTYATATQGAGGSLIDEAQELINMRPKAPEGHYYAGFAYERQGDRANAASEYQKTVQYGGNDQYAIAARERLTALGAPTSDAASTAAPPRSTLPDQPAPGPNKPSGDSSGVPFDPSK